MFYKLCIYPTRITFKKGFFCPVVTVINNLATGLNK